MNTLALTQHAAIRAAQRGIAQSDIELIVLIGTEVEAGYFVRQKDYFEAERVVKRFLQRLRHVVGKRVVLASGRIITTYHASDSKQRRPRRRARQSNLID
jgi:hypothetical protein